MSKSSVNELYTINGMRTFGKYYQTLNGCIVNFVNTNSIYVQYNQINFNELITFFFVITERREIYFIAIIDVLTQYGVKKQVRSYSFLFTLY